MISWIRQGWKFAWTFYPLLFPVLATMFLAELLLVYLNGTAGMVEFPLGVTVLKAATREMDPGKIVATIAIAAVVNPLLYVFAEFLVVNLLRGKSPSAALSEFCKRILVVLTTVWELYLMIVFGLLLLVIPGIYWGLEYMFAPLLAVEHSDAFGFSRLLTAERLRKLFALNAVFTVAGLLTEALVVNLLHLGFPVALTVWAVLYFVFEPWEVGSTVAAFFELYNSQMGKWYGLTLTPASHLPRIQKGWAVLGAVALLGAGYLGWSTSPLIKPVVCRAPTILFPEPPPISTQAAIVLGTPWSHDFVLAPMPEGNRIAVLTSYGLEVRTVPDLSLEAFIPMPCGWNPVLAVSPTGEELVCACNRGGDPMITVIRLPNEVVWQRKGLGATALAYSPKGDLIALGKGTEVLLLDAATGEEIATLAAVKDERIQQNFQPKKSEPPVMRDLDFDPSGERLVVVYQKWPDDDFFGLYHSVIEVPTGKVLRVRRGYARFTPDGLLATLPSEKSMEVLNPATGELLWNLELPGEENIIASPKRFLIGISTDPNRQVIFRRGRLFVVNYARRNLEFNELIYLQVGCEEYLKLRIGKLHLAIPWAKASFGSSWFGPLESFPLLVGKWAVVPMGRTLHVLPLEGDERPSVVLRLEPLIALDPAGRYLLTGFAHWYWVYRYKLPSGTLMGSLMLPDLAPLEEISVDPSGELVGALGHFGRLYILRFVSPGRWTVVSRLELEKGNAHLLGWWEGKLWLALKDAVGCYDFGSEFLETYPVPELKECELVADLNRGKLAFLASNGQEVRVIDLATNEPVVSLPGKASAVSLSPTDELLAVARGEKLELRRLPSAEPVLTVDPGVDYICALAFGPRGELACGGFKGVVVIEPSTGDELFRDDFTVPDRVTSLHFNGDTLAVGLDGGEVLVYFLRY